MTSSEKKQLQITACKIRIGAIDAVYGAKAGHPGGSLSAADVYTYLYFKEMNIDPKNPKWADRDRFVLSKGHVTPGLYSTLAQRGFFPVEDLPTFRHIDSYLQGHPNMNMVPGVDMSTGSLGQGISVAVGMALAAKQTGKNNRVYSLLGDGEIQEGQVWEACMFAAHYKLDNFVAIVDNNGLQIDGEVAKVSSREFMVPAPQLAITFAGYTSHSLYEEGRIDEANAADGSTLYEPSVSVNISPTLLSSGKFDYKIEYAFDGAITSAEGNYVNIGNKTLAPRVEPYELSADITFDGTRVQSSTSFRITGIPFLFAPPTTATWQKNGKVNDEDGYARFGNMSDGSQTFRYQKVAIPAGTRLAFDYKFTTTGDVGNTFTIYAGEQVLVASEKISAWNSVTYESVDAVTISTMTTYINCVNSYGAGLSYTDLYRVGLSYRQ